MPSPSEKIQPYPGRRFDSRGLPSHSSRWDSIHGSSWRGVRK
ncbi:Uncharacterised protein [Mycobacteroides abscessus]|nr:Uncharacterised protein [Mycobacteroides abscessus]